MVLKNHTQKNYTLVASAILRDPNLCLFDRGLLCTIISLPDGWNLSVYGLAAILPDGKDAIRAGLKRLEAAGYLRIEQTHNERGKFAANVVEVFAEPTHADEIQPADHIDEQEKNVLQEKANEPKKPENTAFHPCAGYPTTVDPSTGKTPKYNTKKNKNKKYIYARTRAEKPTPTNQRSRTTHKPRNAFCNFEQRSYDYDALERAFEAQLLRQMGRLPSLSDG